MIRDSKDKAVTSFAHTLFTVWTVSQYVTVQRQTVIMWMAAWNFQQVFAFEKLVRILLKERYTLFYINYTCINYHRLVKITVKFVFEKYLPYSIGNKYIRYHSQVTLYPFCFLNRQYFCMFWLSITFEFERICFHKTSIKNYILY